MPPETVSPQIAPPARRSGGRSSGPARAFWCFLLAAFYFLLARVLAQHGARGLVSPDWSPLVEQAMLAFLLLFGYAGMGFVLDGQLRPVANQGLPWRPGWLGEAGMGAAFGWAIAVACVLPVALVSGIAFSLSASWASFGWLAVYAAYFLLAALVTEVAFRGYPFQCAIRMAGELPAALAFSVLYAILPAWLPGGQSGGQASGGAPGIAVGIALGLLLSMAYLRTRALWLPWGLHFAWVASRALLFGLPVGGVSSRSPVIQGLALGPSSLSGGDFGLDGAWISCAVLLLAMPFVYRATRDLSFLHNAPVLEPGGIPVDLDAASRRQHEAASRPDVPEVKPLVQILPAAAPVEAASLPLPRAAGASAPIPEP